MNKELNYLIFGRKPVLDLINTEPKIIEVVHLQKNNEEIKKQLLEHKIPFIVHDKDNFFSKFNMSVNHQGFALKLKQKEQFLKIVNFDFLKKNLSFWRSFPIVLILDEIMDMQNLGAILRTAYAANVMCVVFKKNNQAQINDYIVKTSMGFISKINLLPVSNLANALEKLKEIGFWVYATTLSNNSQNYAKIDYSKPVALVIGNEQKGVSQLLLKNSDFLVKIPMINPIDSLNVSVATGILLFHIIENK